VKILGADERLNSPRGLKILIAGPTGVGKTSLLRTVDPRSALLLDSDAGDLSIQDVPVDTIQINDWQTAASRRAIRVRRPVRRIWPI
jgi:ABC-type transport system involved in cytochrome bd biosynthesis fused ATPase/permease subunit